MVRVGIRMVMGVEGLMVGDGRETGHAGRLVVELSSPSFGNMNR